jgi:hypothetical protein
VFALTEDFINWVGLLGISENEAQGLRDEANHQIAKTRWQTARLDSFEVLAFLKQEKEEAISRTLMEFTWQRLQELPTLESLRTSPLPSWAEAVSRAKAKWANIEEETREEMKREQRWEETYKARKNMEHERKGDEQEAKAQGERGIRDLIKELSARPGNEDSIRQWEESGHNHDVSVLASGSDNPGFIEGFYGEVDDVIAAADYLKKLDYVDPKRIYLGGHSTGGTLALFVGESTNCFRSIFSFGPVADIRVYGRENLPFDLTDPKEVELRAPGRWLQAIRNPTYVFEGTEQRSNIKQLESLSRTSRNPHIHFHSIKGASHFSVLAPITRLVATKILQDTGPSLSIALNEKEISEALAHK